MKNHTFMNDDIILLTYFGSRLFGTSTENSDTDIKGIFIPTPYQILMNKIPEQYNFSTKKGLVCREDATEQAKQLLGWTCAKANIPIYVYDKSGADTFGVKNTKDDIDIELLSIHKFMKLLCEGDTMAIDMLHTTLPNILQHNMFWNKIYFNRHMFYTNRLEKFVDYCRDQAAKYGIKGSRVNALKEFIDFISNYESHKSLREIKLRDIWDDIEENEFLAKTMDEEQKLRMIYICGKKFHETVRLSHILPIVKDYYNTYGARAIKAANNEGIDWKAVSHAIRAAYEIKSILTKGDVTFPLEEADIIRSVKLGQMDFITEAEPLLTKLAGELEKLSLESKLPSMPDYDLAEEIVLECMSYPIKRAWRIGCLSPAL